MSIDEALRQAVAEELRTQLPRFANEVVERITRAIGSRKLSVDETAEVLGVSVPKVWNMIAAGEIRVIRIGRRTLIDSADLPSAAKQDEEIETKIRRAR